MRTYTALLNGLAALLVTVTIWMVAAQRPARLDIQPPQNPITPTRRCHMAAKVTEYDNVTMSAISRCDRCNAQAYVEVILPGGAKLLFCAHDYVPNEEKLKEIASEIHDHRKFLHAQEHQPV